MPATARSAVARATTVPPCVFFTGTAATEIYTLSLHDALPIYMRVVAQQRDIPLFDRFAIMRQWNEQGDFDLFNPTQDRKSTRLNSSHGYISYAVFCLKKKK